MATQWIAEAATGYGQHLVSRRREEEQRRREEDVERERRNRLAENRMAHGAALWAEVQYLLKAYAGEFNTVYGDKVMRVEARGDGTFNVIVPLFGGVEKVATLTYAEQSATLSWQVFGGASGTLTVGLKPGAQDLQFMNGADYVSTGHFSQGIIQSLLP